MGEHLPYKQRVTGSSPVTPTNHSIRNEKRGPVVQLARTPACHAGGRRFEPVLDRHFASVAQLVEQLTCNQQVGGSSPFTSSICGGVPEWPKGTDCKSVGSAFEGSNPSPTTIYAEVAQW